MTQKYTSRSALARDLIRWLEIQIPKLIRADAKNKLKGRAGGCLTVIDPKVSRTRPILQVYIGEVVEEKFSKYGDLSLEKATRMAEHPEHWCSAQSRDPDDITEDQLAAEGGRQRRWGGAIRSHKTGLIYSFSGLPEACDHAMMVWVVSIVENWSEDDITQFMHYLDDIPMWNDMIRAA